ncbi:MAG: glycosyltransferase family 2 protein [Acidimicrobiales bacterium]
MHAQSSRPDELLVVVDHNEELLARAAAAFPSVTVLANQAAERGPGGARTTGMERSHGVVAFIDDDAQAEPSRLEKIIEAFRDPQVMIVGSQVVPRWEASRPPGSPTSSTGSSGAATAGRPAAQT